MISLLVAFLVCFSRSFSVFGLTNRMLPYVLNDFVFDEKITILRSVIL